MGTAGEEVLDLIELMIKRIDIKHQCEFSVSLLYSAQCAPDGCARRADANGAFDCDVARPIKSQSANAANRSVSFACKSKCVLHRF